MTPETGLEEGTLDFRTMPFAPWLPIAVATMALPGHSWSQESYTRVVAGSSTDETASITTQVMIVSDRDVLAALARIHRDLTENAIRLDLEVEEVIDAHLWELD